MGFEKKVDFLKKKGSLGKNRASPRLRRWGMMSLL